MKKSKYTFSEGFTNKNSDNDNPFMTFDWLKAANEIKMRLLDHPDLIAEAGLQNDWQHTGGVIFKNGKPISDTYTYLESNWAIPTLILSWDGEYQEEIKCYELDSQYNSGSKWCSKSLHILS